MIKIWRFDARASLPKPPVRGARPKPIKTQWSSVSLVPGPRACAAVKYLARKRWLSSDAPRFPVQRCDVRTCECRYAHHADRRGMARRGVDREALPRQFEGAERRAKRRDRREPEK